MEVWDWRNARERSTRLKTELGKLEPTHADLDWFPFSCGRLVEQVKEADVDGFVLRHVLVVETVFTSKSVL